MNARVALPVALLLCLPGCKQMEGSVPGWDDPVGPQDAAADAEGDDGEALADADTPADGGDRPGDDDDGDAGDAGTQVAVADPPPVDDGGADPAPAASDDGGKKPDPDPASVAKLELPKPKYRSVDKSCGKDPGVGQKLKSFKLSTSDGKKVSNGTYRGRVLLVNFWGTWCKPCLKELPEFDHLYRRYRKHGMAMLAIATDEDAEPVNDFKKKRKIAAKLALGGEDYAGKYSSPQFPFTFIVDTNGTIKASYRGYKPKCMGKLEADLRDELHKRAEARAGK